jgi:phosphoglycerol transferase MdoB-like AlkP superfamily enzyme
MGSRSQNQKMIDENMGSKNNSDLSLFWPSVFLTIALVVTKATYVKVSHSWNIWDWDVPLENYFNWVYFSWAACVSRSDLLFALGTGLIGELALRLTSSYRRFSQGIFYGFILFGTLCVAYAVIGRQAFAYFGAQLTSNLLTLGLGGDVTKLQSSILAYATPGVLVALVGAPVLYLLSVRVMCRVSLGWSSRSFYSIYALGFVGVVLWFCLGFRLVDNGFFIAQDRYIVENPHWAMIRSALPEFLGAKSRLLSVEFSPDDMLDFKNPGPSVKAATHSDPLVQKLRARPIKNVILIVLESVGAHYLTAYDKNSPVTPRLAAETKNAVVFDSYYTPVGWTAFALTSILHATPPPLKRYNTMNFRLANIPTPSIATVLRERGYQTVFLASGDPQWANKGIFDNGDFRQVRTELELAPAKRNSSWGVRDKYLFDEIQQFLDGNKNDSKPFFMIAWTDQTHHPYSLGSDKKNKTKGDHQRYLSILKEVDGYIGELLAYLREKNDDTLVVITGDHGEAFRQIHNTTGHGYSVYDEEVKVPLILWNPRLIPEGYRIPTVGSHVDLAPTLLDLLGEPAPAEWQGSSLFSPNHPPRAYFFAAARGQYLLGVREAQWKYIIDARREEEELYDLKKDPMEQVNIAADYPERAIRLRQRLAAMLKANEDKYAWMSVQ